jgi:hypothetical protein
MHGHPAARLDLAQRRPRPRLDEPACPRADARCRRDPGAAAAAVRARDTLPEVAAVAEVYTGSIAYEIEHT